MKTNPLFTDESNRLIFWRYWSTYGKNVNVSDIIRSPGDMSGGYFDFHLLLNDCLNIPLCINYTDDVMLLHVAFFYRPADRHNPTDICSTYILNVYPIDLRRCCLFQYSFYAIAYNLSWAELPSSTTRVVIPTSIQNITNSNLSHSIIHSSDGTITYPPGVVMDAFVFSECWICPAFPMSELSIIWVSIHSAVRHLTAQSCEVSKPRDWALYWSWRSETRQASGQHCCRDVCQISQRLKKSKPASRGFETSQYFAVRRPSA